MNDLNKLKKKGNRLLLDRESRLIKIYSNFSPKIITIIQRIKKIFISDMFHILFIFFFFYSFGRNNFSIVK